MLFRLQTFMVGMSWMTRMLFRISTNALTFPSHVTPVTTEGIKFNEFQFIIILISISQKARERIHKNAFRIEWVSVSCEFFTTLSSTFITFILIFACMSFYDTLIIIFHLVLSDWGCFHVMSIPFFLWVKIFPKSYFGCTNFLTACMFVLQFFCMT